MTAAALSRRGFLTRAAAGAVGLLGGSFVGGLSTRAWASPLRHLRAGGRPVIGQPRSVVHIGIDEAVRREHLASRRPEVRSLVRELISSGYKRWGEPSGVDGVSGWETEGGRAVSLGFAKDGSEGATVFVTARWWDEKRREAWPCEDVMPDVYSREVVYGPSGTPSLVRFRYVDEEGGLATREFEAGSVADACNEPDCHLHPPGVCPDSCNVCSHCYYAANVCSAPPPDCSACGYCALCVHFACGVSCSMVCAAVCDSLSEKYCCDWTTAICCLVDLEATYPPARPPDCI